MPRIRTIKPEFWQDEKLAPLTPIARLVFLGLISMADDAGRVVDNVKSIDGFIFPLSNDTSRESLDTLARLSRVLRYRTKSGQQLIQVLNWHHQKVDKPSKYVLPAPTKASAEAPTTSAPDEESSRDARESLDESSRSDLVPSTNDLGPPTQYQGPSTSDRVSARGEPPAALFETLPEKAKELLTLFYEFPAMTEKQRERYRYVAMQLVDTIDAKHPGPKIRGGQRVKARSVEHLNDICADVMRDPPNDRDLAILWVLKKLLDPPKGPTETELARRNEAAVRQEEDLYHDEARAAGIQWAKNHPDEYQPIIAELEARYRGKNSAFTNMAKAEELTHLCAKAAGFPSFEEWREDMEAPLEMPA